MLKKKKSKTPTSTLSDYPIPTHLSQGPFPFLAAVNSHENSKLTCFSPSQDGFSSWFVNSYKYQFLILE